MADTSQPNPFMDMFTQFGRDLKLPSVDVDTILDHHRKNLDALQRSASAAASGAQSLMSKQREILQETMREITEMAQSYRAPGDPREMMSKQADFARRSFEAAVKNAGEVAEIVKKSGDESVDILRERIRATMDDLGRGKDGPR